MSRNIYKTYFSHDIYSRQDQKIKDMLVHFRKENNLKAQAAYCIFWWIVEDMHADDYPVSKIDVFADDYRCDVEFLKSILEDFGLFRIENGCYISDRVLKNIAEQEEKSEKAKKAIAKRWKKKEDEAAAPNDDDLEFINQVLQIYNTEFKKTQIVSNENKSRINKITKDNKLTLDIWQKVFENARRGWDFEDCKNKQPNLKTILDKWDLFASGDYYLAPDREKIKREKEAAERQREIEQEEERLRIEKEQKEKDAAFNAISDAASAIAYINRYSRLPIGLLQRSVMVKELREKFDFTCDDIMAARGEGQDG